MYLSVSGEGILRGAVPIKGCVVGPQPHVWISCPRRSSKGRRAESKAGISSSRTRQRLGRGPADGNRSRAVKARCGQNQAVGMWEHLRIQPTPTSPFQNQPLRPFKSTTTFLLSHSKTPRIPLHPLSLHPTQLSLASNSTLRIVPSFIDQGVRGGAMAKLTS